ncbi:hypothetical protein [Ornithinimicrobium pekingense]|uniref:hypothetical protein n=1 Tax=Ornithinimicrobium pekingense TaxID=384677 RepID=UPI0012ECB07F|nr:hypothetical protein [Ornithinimicrobium pekingense]
MRNRAGVVLAVAVGVLLLVAVVAAVLSATRPGPQLTEGSPEAAVRDYVAAVVEGDREAAAARLDPEGPCTEEDLRLVGEPSDGRIVLRDVELDGAEATVRVDVVHDGEGPFGAGEWRDELRFDLRRDGEHWVVTGEPWPMYGCQAPRPAP